jgi:hypothetical protein
MADRASFGLDKASAIGADPHPLASLDLPALLDRLFGGVEAPINRPGDAAWQGAKSIGEEPNNISFENEALAMAPKLPKNIPLGWLGKLAGKAGERIPEPQQTGVSPMDKVPRFRSPLGTFVKHDGEWWRLRPQPPLDPNVTLERLDDTGAVTASKRIPVKDMIENAQQSNAFSNAAKAKK